MPLPRELSEIHALGVMDADVSGLSLMVGLDVGARGDGVAKLDAESASVALGPPDADAATLPLSTRTVGETSGVDDTSGVTLNELAADRDGF